MKTADYSLNELVNIRALLSGGGAGASVTSIVAANVSEVSAQMATLNTTASELSLNALNINTAVSEIDLDFDTLMSTASEISSQMVAGLSTSSQLSAWLELANTTVSDIDSQLGVLNPTASEISSQLAVMNPTVSDIDSQLGVLNPTVSLLSSDLAVLNTTASVLAAGLSLLQTAVSEGNGALWTLRSVAASHFVSSVSPGYNELAILSGLPSKSAIIEAISLRSDQNLAWDLVVLSTATTSTDLDVEATIDWVTWAAADAVRYNETGPYIYAMSGIKIPYYEPSQLLNLALINRDTVTKNAGATGEVVVEIRGRSA